MRLGVSLIALLFLLVTEPIRLTPSTTVTFASLPVARQILERRDRHLCGLSLFDRQARAGRGAEVSLEEIVHLFGESARDWDENEKRLLRDSLRRIEKRLAPLGLPFPSEIVLVKTSGREEGGAFYTRGNAVMMPAAALKRGKENELDNILLHEFFHVLSRENPDLMRRLYATIGFYSCGMLELPEPLRSLTIANPDVSDEAYAITVRRNGSPVQVVPVIHSRIPFDEKRGGTFFKYLKLSLVMVEDRGEVCRVVTRDGAPVTFLPTEVEGYFEQVGRNTEYVTDPQEILADNFVLLVQGRTDVPTPAVLSRMREVLSSSKGG